MAVSLIGTVTADFDTRETVVFPRVRVEEGKGYLFFLRTVPLSVVSENQYMLVIPVFRTRLGRVELPLDSKFFPKNAAMMVSVPVPKLDEFSRAALQIALLPRALYRTSADVGSMQVQLLWDRNEEVDAESISL